MATRDARTIANMTVSEVWELPPGPLTLRFDDGQLKTTRRRTIFSWYIWEFHRRYPETPLLKEHHIQDATLGKGTHVNLLSKALWACYDIYRARGVTNEELAKVAYEVTNHLYNDMTMKLESYVTSISALDFLEVVDHPTIKKANEKVRPNTETVDFTVDNTYGAIKGVLMDPKELPTNGVAKAARSGLVSMGQILQCVGPRGYTTDIDSNIFPNPILRGFFHGIRSLEDAMKESRSAAKALFFTKTPMQMSEYFNRNIQLSAATLSNLHMGDCGSDYLIPFTVSPGDIDNGLEGIYYKNPKGKLEPITRRDRHLVGRTIEIRNVFGCEHPDPYGVCSTCFGDLAHSFPRNTNLGHFSAAVIQGKIGQRLLSTKHEDASSTVETKALDDYTVKFLKPFGDENTLGIRDGVRKGKKKVELCIPEDGAKNLFDVEFVSDVNSLVVTRITEIATVALHIHTGSAEEQRVVLDLTNGPRHASLTHKALEFVKEKGWSMSKDGEYVVDITDWDYDEPMFELPLKHHSMFEYMKLIEKMIKGTAGGQKELRTIVDYDDPAQALAAFYDLVSSKMEVSISHLQVVMLSTMARNPKGYDYRLPKPGHSGEFASYKNDMLMRSLAPMMAFQRQAPTLEDVLSYNVKVRPRHPLDHLLLG